jgi:hypothetical protein
VSTDGDRGHRGDRWNNHEGDSKDVPFGPSRPKRVQEDPALEDGHHAAAEGRPPARAVAIKRTTISARRTP